MKLKLAFKTLYRSPVKTALVFLLLIAVTFALFSQVMEYAVTLREIDRAAEQYDGVGTVQTSPVLSVFMGSPYANDPRYAFRDPRIGEPEHWKDLADPPKSYVRLTQEQTDYVSSLPYVESVDMRYMTAGVSDEYVRLDDGDHMYSYTATCLASGKLENIILMYESEVFNDKTYRLTFTDCHIVSGIMDKYPDGVFYLDMMITEEGALVGMVGRSIIYQIAETTKSTMELIDSLIPGEYYAFVSRYEPNRFDLNSIFYDHTLGDCFTEEYAGIMWNIEDAPANWLEMPEYAEIKQVSDIIDLGHHTFDMVYTDDTSSIMRFAEGKMTILEGRGIEPSDSVNNPNVCVVSREFAAENGLAVGDTIDMDLGDKLFEQYASLGAVPLVPARVSDSYTEASLEIVGIYANLDSDSERAQKPNWVYSLNAIFVPQALLNVSPAELENHQLCL